mmetsp:Transcript_16148/g.24508  ORF Transcript_16148/g.24508 Transcript_16148/m.24508 type:complete len:194 (+) Transcript_16148:86-667(+)|eukprot:CAMPEP_0196142838 /NCGR_PEP_ID=MMETSP0910-20130528/12421_1 /TAXON_ID=49265 /ORGANISM="Thalassiosira rotula, Strain GSO102" /LENGTH=193 /DNA_ID=CAMNT_0041404207 /DNA_START=88 /DNA_END=669 /DNA_ORIENTATION=-
MSSIQNASAQGPITPMCPIPFHVHSFPAYKQSKRRRRVMFKSAVTIPIDCSMTPEEKSRSYYRKEELKKLRHADVLSTRNDAPQHAATIQGGCLIGLEADPALRGLERYLYPARPRNKLIAIKGLLKYYNHLNASPDKTSDEKAVCLARTSAKLSHWSRMVARETGRLDSLRALGGDYSIPINEPVRIAPFPL